MKRFKKTAAGLALAFSLSIMGSAYAQPAYDDDEVPDVYDSGASERRYSDSSRADDWFAKEGGSRRGGLSGRYGATGGGDYDDEESTKKKKEKVRFVKILSDDSFDYYLDTQNSRWRNMPNSSLEYIIDAWIGFVERDDDKLPKSYDESAPEGSPSSFRQLQAEKRKYYMEHYYVWPKRQKIQFLCELEVTGRPENTVNQREYNFKNWEELVPGSVEDDIYHAVIKNVKRKNKLHDSNGKPMSVKDALDEYLRIGI